MSVWWGEKEIHEENWIGLCITHKKFDFAHPCATSSTALIPLILLANDFTDLSEKKKKKKKKTIWRCVDPAWKFISIETMQMELEYSRMTYSK